MFRFCSDPFQCGLDTHVCARVFLTHALKKECTLTDTKKKRKLVSDYFFFPSRPHQKTLKFFFCSAMRALHMDTHELVFFSTEFTKKSVCMHRKHVDRHTYTKPQRQNAYTVYLFSHQRLGWCIEKHLQIHGPIHTHDSIGITL
jgi:hypothetical protein